MHELYFGNSRVEILKKRAERCRCKYCGRELRLKRITFSDYEDARKSLTGRYSKRKIARSAEATENMWHGRGVKGVRLL